MLRNKHGFTLVELIVGIVVLGIAMMVMNTMLVSQSKDALEPLYRLRASQLGQSIMQNILSRAYDENADHNGGLYRCGEKWPPNNVIQSCFPTLGVNIGKGEVVGEHQNFNDVDDFIITDFQSAVTYGDALGNPLPAQYNNYAVKVEVEIVTPDRSKKVSVTIKTPSNEQIRFSALKGNY